MTRRFKLRIFRRHRRQRKFRRLLFTTVIIVGVAIGATFIGWYVTESPENKTVDPNGIDNKYFLLTKSQIKISLKVEINSNRKSWMV